MRRSFWLLPIAVLLGATSACESGRHSPSGFRLPLDGDVEKGKQTFVALGCHTCHQVSGADLPTPTVEPPVPVVLGGAVPQAMSDGYLVTSIIYPSYRLAPQPKELITAGGRSRMPAHENLTVRQLTDVVAFLQSRYTVRRPPPRYPYY